MAWKVALRPEIYADIQGVARVRPDKVDYVMVRDGGVLEVGYVIDGMQQVDMYFPPGSWLWCKRLP